MSVKLTLHGAFCTLDRWPPDSRARVKRDADPLSQLYVTVGSVAELGHRAN